MDVTRERISRILELRECDDNKQPLLNYAFFSYPLLPVFLPPPLPPPYPQSYDNNNNLNDLAASNHVFQLRLRVEIKLESYALCHAALHTRIALFSFFDWLKGWVNCLGFSKQIGK